MAIAIGPPSTGGGNDVFNIAVGHTVPSGLTASYLLVFATSLAGGGGIEWMNACRWGGSGGTLMTKSVDFGFDTRRRLQIYTLASPTPQASTAYLSGAGGEFGVKIAVTVYHIWHVKTLVVGHSGSVAASCVIASTNRNDYGLDACYSAGAVGAGQTQLSAISDPFGYAPHKTSWEKGTGGNITMSWSAGSAIAAMKATANPTGGAAKYVGLVSDFMRDLKRGLLPGPELVRRHREVLALMRM